MREEKISTKAWLIILLLVLLIIIHVMSLGQVDPRVTNLPDELAESRENAKHRHRKLIALIKRQKKLKNKLDRKFKRIYLGVRILLVALWAGLLTTLYFFGEIKGLGDLLTYSQFSILLLVTIHFITFGSIKNINLFIGSLKERTENWVYGKYVDLDDRIDTNKKESRKLERNINEMTESIEAINTLAFNNKDSTLINK